jgi:S1-C subfamily serine protease
MLVSAVVPGSPAEAAGFQVGDGIWSMNGQHVYDLEMIRSIVAENEGTPIDVEVVTPSGDITIRQVTPQGGAIGVDLCDALECDLPEAAEPQDTPGVPGMQITEVLPGSPAEEAGFEVGQVIEQMNGQLIYDVETVREIVAANEGVPIETVLIIPEAAITRYVTPRDGAIGVDLCRVGACP